MISVYKEQDDGVYSDSLLTFTYQTTGWKDILTAVTVDGVTEYISGYDSAGNPGYYLGYIDGVIFENRNLTALYTPWDEFLYSYNASGIRTSKNINGVVTNYVLEGSKVIKETKAGTALQYYYDSNDEIVGFTYNGVAYVYLKNLQNDIIAIADVNGNILVKYYYDAFGNILLVNDTSGISLGTKNPFRFKSYYYDEETQFYYLNSRYYDPFTGRFISADDASLLLGGEDNLFRYCDNNPVSYSDPFGVFAIPAIVALAVTSAIINAIVQLVSNILAGRSGREIFRGVFGAAIGGAVNTTILTCLWFFPGNYVIAAFAGGVVQAILDFIEGALIWKTKDWKQFGVDIILNTACNLAGNFLGGKAIKVGKTWFQPRHFKSIFTGSFGQKLIMQSGIGALLNGLINYIKIKLSKMEEEND
ncbi:MAG TPA: hypothetical protein DD618_01215 [Acholeplasmatales bacterium]|nr:hypothetical protein [Acholeplasmatales bacterium]